MKPRAAARPHRRSRDLLADRADRRDRLRRAVLSATRSSNGSEAVGPPAG
jgi:hypothetical protein